MIYRALGNTGMNASIIGLGAEHLDTRPYNQVEETIHAALENNINIMDVFMPGGEIRKNIGRALGSRRKDMIIQGHIGSVDLKQQYDISRDLPTVMKYFESLLSDVGTDYIDVGMLFFIDSEEDFDRVFNSEILTYAQNLKKQGTIRAIGASSHNPIIAKKVVESGVVEVLLFSINPAFDMVPADKSVFDALDSGFERSTLLGIDPVRADLYRYCESRNIGITVMKTYGAGKLLSSEYTPFSKPLTPVQCIHYALSRPSVASALVGCKTRGEILQAIEYLSANDAERDYSTVISSFDQDFSGNCMYCNHCRPCPSDIDIAAVTKYLDIAKLSPGTVPQSISQHYKALLAHGSDCIACGSCEERCPFSVGIINNMQEASEVFGV